MNSILPSDPVLRYLKQEFDQICSRDDIDDGLFEVDPSDESTFTEFIVCDYRNSGFFSSTRAEVHGLIDNSEIGVDDADIDGLLTREQFNNLPPADQDKVNHYRIFCGGEPGEGFLIRYPCDFKSLGVDGRKGVEDESAFSFLKRVDDEGVMSNLIALALEFDIGLSYAGCDKEATLTEFKFKLYNDVCYVYAQVGFLHRHYKRVQFPDGTEMGETTSDEFTDAVSDESSELSDLFNTDG